jgi:cephalosporin hydroxylase
LKCPLDLWIYQEIIQDTLPDLIIESGTFLGGTTLFLASICELIGHGKIVSIDVDERENRAEHNRITYLTGSSISTEILDTLKALKSPTDKVMVILDSDHHQDHVFSELKHYSPFVTLNNYLIVEDTNINGHPVYSDFGPGPMEAIERFLSINDGFVVDEEREKFYLTFNPCGYLKRVRPHKSILDV